METTLRQRPFILIAVGSWRALSHGNWYRKVQRAKGVIPWDRCGIVNHCLLSAVQTRVLVKNIAKGGVNQQLVAISESEEHF